MPKEKQPMGNKRQCLRLFFLIISFLTSANGFASELTVSKDGKLHLAHTAYSLDVKNRTLFQNAFDEKMTVLEKNNASLGTSKVLNYSDLAGELFDVEISKGAIYRIILYSRDIKINMAADTLNIGDNITALITGNNCEFHTGDEQGTFIDCLPASGIIFYTECSGKLTHECFIQKVLLNNY